MAVNWWRVQRDNVVIDVTASNYTQSLAELDELITKLQTYIDNLPTQAERDTWNETLLELQHAKNHLLMLQPGWPESITDKNLTSDIAVQKDKCNTTLDNIAVI